ncbi:MAG: DUF1552 domain-containing protein [Myxococcota bacterium]|nr:DUF1552 domain-containing protein [Myxococcota bacterium]
MIKPLNRRAFLRGASGVAMALPFLDAMTPLSASAAVDPTRPRRIMFVFKPNGDDPTARMTNTTETGFAFNSVRAALTPYRSDLIVMENVDKRHGRLPDGERADGHQQGGSALGPWKSGTGSFPIGGTSDFIGYIQGPTIDVELGRRIREQVPSMPRSHLYMRVGDTGNNIWNVHSHNGPIGTQAPANPSTNPYTLYSTLFSNLQAGDAPDPALVRRIAKQQSALDLVNGELTTLKTRLGAADRARLDRHTDAMRDIERSLVLPEVTNACAPFALGTQLDPYAAANYSTMGELFFKISALAFACDTTRVVNFNWSGNTNNRTYPNLGLSNPGSGHHDLSHLNNEPAFADIRRVNTELWSQTVKLYELLKNTDDGDGTLWDHTLVVHWNELGRGYAHSNHDNMVIFAGVAHNYFRRGRYLNLQNASTKGFSDVLVSCMHYMGYENVTTFGEPELATGGPVTGLT